MKSHALTLSLLACLAASCAGDSTESSPSQLPISQLPETYYLAAEPSGALDVAAARTKAEAGKTLAVRGVIGGSERPFVEGLAVFTLVDPALASCVGDGTGCETPWDYCCVDSGALVAGSLTVEFRDSAGPIATDARGFHGLDHLSSVVVEGRSELDDRGNLTLVASGLHISTP